jgi:hypothetical protein
VTRPCLPPRVTGTETCAAEPRQHLSGAAEFIEFLQHESDRLLHADIGIELDRPVGA